MERTAETAGHVVRRLFFAALGRSSSFGLGSDHGTRPATLTTRTLVSTRRIRLSSRPTGSSDPRRSDRCGSGSSPLGSRRRRRGGWRGRRGRRRGLFLLAAGGQTGGGQHSGGDQRIFHTGSLTVAGPSAISTDEDSSTSPTGPAASARRGAARDPNGRSVGRACAILKARTGSFSQIPARHPALARRETVQGSARLAERSTAHCGTKPGQLPDWPRVGTAGGDQPDQRETRTLIDSRSGGPADASAAPLLP
jgi:hypothetical protein